MEFSIPLVEGTLIRRHSRFLADVQLGSGELITAHTSNTGAMTGCKEPGSRVWLSKSENPKRKYAYTWEIIESKTNSGIVPVGINTMLSNKLVREAIENGVIKELRGYSEIRPEVKYGQENSRIDLLLQGAEAGEPKMVPCYVEVKNVTLVEDEIAYFPDAVSKRGAKHLRELTGVVAQGSRAVIFYCIQRTDARELRPADAIDPEYAKSLRISVEAGVEPVAYMADVSNKGIQIVESIPINVYC